MSSRGVEWCRKGCAHAVSSRHSLRRPALGVAAQPKASSLNEDPLRTIFTDSPIAELRGASSKTAKSPAVTVDIDAILQQAPSLKSFTIWKDVPVILLPGKPGILFWRVRVAVLRGFESEC